MSTIPPGDVGPEASRSGSARVSRIPRGPRTRSQANTAPDPGEQRSPLGIVAEKNSLDEKFEKMGSEIRQEIKKNLEDELALIRKQLELQSAEFHTVLGELTARVDLVEKERGETAEGLEPEVLASLKLSVKDARRDANQASESLGKFRTSIDDRFDRAAQRLKDLEQGAGPEPQDLDQEPLPSGREGDLRSKKDKAAKQRSSKSKSSKKDRRRRSKSHCSDDPEDRDSHSESHGPSEDGGDDSSNHSGDSEHRSEEGNGISSSKKISSRRGGVTSSASRRDKDAEPEDVATRRGPRWEELEELNPTNYLFKKLLSYRTYRLRNPQTYLSSSRRTAVRKIRRDIPPKVKKDNTFTGEDGVLVLDFLAKLVQEFDTQEMNEGQAIRLLPEFLSGIALRQYTSVSQTAGSHHGKVSVWPEAVQWLLRSFATDESIRQAVLALRDVQQRPSEDEMEFYIRLTDAGNRCGNVHSMEEQMTMFIEGLDASIKPMVSQYRQDNRDVSFLRLVNYAKAQGSASRAKEKRTKKVTIHTPPTFKAGNKQKTSYPMRKTHGAVHLAESISGSDERSAQRSQENQYEGAFVAEGDFIEPSEGYGHEDYGASGTSTLPTPTYTTESFSEPTDPVMMFRGRGHTPAPRLPMEDRGTTFRRPGWMGRPQNQGRPPARGGPRPQYPVKKHGLVCYHCYEKGHAAPTCILSLREMHQVLGNYEALSPMERLGIPSTSYLKVKNWFDSQTASTPSGSGPESNRPFRGPAAGPASSDVRRNPQQSGN